MLVHLSPHVHSLGGMQTVVQRNLALDRVRGVQSQSLSLFDRIDPSLPSACCLGAGGWWSLRAIQQALGQRIRESGATLIYYNGWGMPVLAGHDHAGRRLAFMVTDWPGFSGALVAMKPWCDGFICVSEELAAATRRSLPDYPADRIMAVPLSALPAWDGGERRPLANGVLEVGFVARLERNQKRADLLPALVKAVRAIGAGVRWHVVGDGTHRVALHRAFAGSTDVVMHGVLRGDDYRRVLAGLDVIVFLSEYEGAPLAMLDAMAAGAVPLFPAIGGLGERYAAGVDPRCVYPAGAVAVAAQRLAALATDPGMAALASRSRNVVAGHGAAAYRQGYENALEKLTNPPRLSQSGGARRSRLTDRLPLGLLTRVLPGALLR